jgi:hypothetical protein
VFLAGTVSRAALFEDKIVLIYALYAARLCASLYSSTVIDVLSVYNRFVPATLLNCFSPGPAMANAVLDIVSLSQCSRLQLIPFPVMP